MAEVTFNRERHIKYFLRCLKTFLPSLYTSNDSNRMLLAFFTVAGLDLLGVLQSKTTPEERQGYIKWIYHCQVPTGGFRAFTGTDFGSENRTPENEAWDPANVPSTFFALVVLVILGDDLSRVKRAACLQWLPRLQRDNGSFGEVLGPGGDIEGGGDLRFCCFAAGTRYILRGKGGRDVDDIRDINVDKLAAFVQACQAYDGGMGEAPFCEAHSGHTYCAMGALTFLGRTAKTQTSPPVLLPGAVEFESLVRWLVARQTAELGDTEESDEEDGPKVDAVPEPLADEELDIDAGLDRLPPLTPPTEESLRYAGFNGRCNKYADTCYSFWNLATLALAQSYNALLEEFSSKDLRTVGNYTLGRLIGKGSFGKVYLASHKLTNGSKVVLKSSSKEDRNLAREIHHHRQFLHPHIARLYEVIVTEKLVWLVLEYCPGDELYNYLLRHGPLAVDKVQRIFTQLVGAVAYVHSKSCVHRDLKLENILLDKHENVKLCDFGFTREYEGKASYLQTFCGTVCYSAPEMLKGEKYAGEKVDVWSLGIILYALLAGELPFDEDDDQVTKARILTEEPVFSDKFPDDAKALINLLLSKRPLIRPGLDEILAHPFLAEHAPEQLVILKIPRPSAFSTPLERTTLQRMKSAGVNIDEVVESVLSQRCDPLAGWWALLIEKEQRKEQKRERKRREREAEAKNIRRLSAASSRLEKISAALVEVDEEGHASANVPLHERGRRDRRSLPSQLAVPELPMLPEPAPMHSTRQRPPPPPKDQARRPSTLHVSASQPELAQHNGLFRRRTSRRQYPIISQLASLKHWFVESAKRAKSPHAKSSGGQGGHRKFLSEKLSPAKSQDAGKKPTSSSGPVAHPGDLATPTQIKRSSNASSLAPSSASYPNNRHSFPRQQRPLSTSQNHRNSLSPSPITPRGSYRRSSAGLRGRKSTSSSVSSIRSIHHTHTHSKASSVSSNSIGSASTPTARISKSPHSSVKVLPTTPSASARFPSNIRLVRGTHNGFRDLDDHNGRMNSMFNEAAPTPLLYSPSSSLVFARRKRSAFKGPMIHTANLMVSGGMTGPEYPNGDLGVGGPAVTTTTRATGRKSQIIEEEEDMEEDIEEVDTFECAEEEPGSPVEFMSAEEHPSTDHTEELPEQTRKPTLAPAPELDSSPRPPRSSS
ncbi:serine/threonine protein kinase [Aspergillus heteromorphus CBS 117.55]|uniref:Serine/threonine protein kinase n=1 Tax=Aspergillus heteromorphus CBS 117.55 TaxID=1448321 RepID=A0A317VTM2_9EURO|nr:serine/threonine protein kinase [Aspergillus heteromorphus CBS 117.55]PWY76198.1 serine/threonine protein kinase [Aspergillus heteromorphus CBS 117.55]